MNWINRVSSGVSGHINLLVRSESWSYIGGRIAARTVAGPEVYPRRNAALTVVFPQRTHPGVRNTPMAPEPYSTLRSRLGALLALASHGDAPAS